MKIQYNKYDFINWTVTPVEREIDEKEVLKHNAFFQRLIRKSDASALKKEPKNKV